MLSERIEESERTEVSPLQEERFLNRFLGLNGLLISTILL